MDTLLVHNPLNINNIVRALIKRKIRITYKKIITIDQRKYIIKYLLNNILITKSCF